MEIGEREPASIWTDRSSVANGEKRQCNRLPFVPSLGMSCDQEAIVLHVPSIPMQITELVQLARVSPLISFPRQRGPYSRVVDHQRTRVTMINRTLHYCWHLLRQRANAMNH